MSNQTSWVTTNDVVTQNAGLHYRSLGRGLTLPNVRQVHGRDHRLRPDLDGGVLPGQQVMVRCRNSVKVDEFLNSFFIHSIFVQTLSDMCVVLSPVQQGAVTRLTSKKVGGRVNKRGRAANGLSWAEVLTRRSAIPSGSNSGAIICK